MTPNWHTTASKLALSKGNASASAWRHSTGRRVPTDAAWSSMGWLRSVAMMNTLPGSAMARRRVSTPVPAASSRMLVMGSAAARSARSMA